MLPFVKHLIPNMQLNRFWYEYYQGDWKLGQRIINDKIHKQQERHLEIQWEEKNWRSSISYTDVGVIADGILEKVSCLWGKKQEVWFVIEYKEESHEKGKETLCDKII